MGANHFQKLYYALFIDYIYVTVGSYGQITVPDSINFLAPLIFLIFH